MDYSIVLNFDGKPFMNHFYRVLALSLFLCGVVSSSEYRTWSDSTGKYKVEAKFLELNDGTIKLQKKADNKTLTLPLSKLSETDQEAARKLSEIHDAENPFAGGEDATEETEEITSPASAEPAAKIKAVPVRLAQAKFIPTVGAETSWNIETDPAPISKAALKTKSLFLKAPKLGATGFFSEPRFAFSDRLPEKVVAAVSIPNGSKKSTLIFIGDVKQNRVVSKMLETTLTLYGLSPDATQALMVQSLDGYGLGRDRFIALAETEPPTVKCLKLFEPFRQDVKNAHLQSEADIKWAAWVNDDLILALSAKENLILFDKKNGNALWKFAANSYVAPVLSPGRKYLMVADKRLDLFLLEVKTGKLIGRFDFERPEDVSVDQINPENMERMREAIEKRTKMAFDLKFSFSPDGKKAAAHVNGSATIWSLTDGRQEGVLYAASDSHRGNGWLGNDFLLSQGTLFKVEEQLPVWTFTGFGAIDYIDAGKLWIMDRDPKNAFQDSNYILSSITVPTEKFGKADGDKDRDKYALYPGATLKIQIDNQIPDNRKIREHFVRFFKETGVEPDEKASLLFSATMTSQGEKEAKYTTGPMFFGGGSKVTYTSYRYEIKFESDGKVLWSRSLTTSPPDVSVEDLGNNSIQSVVTTKSQPKSDWFLKVNIPKRIPKKALGKSRLTVEGIRP